MSPLQPQWDNDDFLTAAEVEQLKAELDRKDNRFWNTVVITGSVVVMVAVVTGVILVMT